MEKNKYTITFDNEYDYQKVLDIIEEQDNTIMFKK